MRHFTESFKSKITETLFACAACILPLAYTLFWLFRNTQLPGNDASNYLMTAVDIYHHFTDHNFWNGLIHTYSIRGWRPILFPVFAVPFLLIGNGNLFFAYSAVAVLCLLISVIYVFLFLRLKLNRISALVAASLVGLLPFVQAQIVMFYAEAALFPCIVGCIYHLIKSNYFCNLKHTVGFVILFSLAMLIRPVEAATHLIFIFGVFLIAGWHQKIFTVKELLYVLLISLLGLFVFLLMSAIPYLHFSFVPILSDNTVDMKIANIFRYGLLYSFLGSLLLICGLIISPLARIRWKLTTQSLLVPAFLSSLILILIWFLPFAADTFQWIYRTSLGDVANSTGSLTGAQFSWDVLHIYIRAEGTLVIAGIILAALSCFIASLPLRPESNTMAKIKEPNKLSQLLLSTPFIYLLLTIPFPLWEAFYTVQIVTRKLSIVFPFILMALLLIALQEGKGWRGRITGIILLTCAQFILAISLFYTQSYQQPNFILNNTIGYFVPKPVTLHPNPHDVVLNFLDEQAKTYHLHSIGIEVNPGTPDARHPVKAEPIDPFMLSTMLVAARKNYSSAYPYFGSYATDNAKNLSQRFDGIFLSDKATDMLISPAAFTAYNQKNLVERSPSLKTFYDFLMHYSNNTLADIGWKLGPCIVIKSVDEGNYLGCLLLPGSGLNS